MAETTLPTPEELYVEAERRIEEARRTGATELSLDFWGEWNPEGKATWEHQQDKPKDFGLRRLPDSIWKLKRLWMLVLMNNQLTELPEKLGQLTELQSLDLDNNQLVTLPRALGHLRQLQGLYVQKNRLATLPTEVGQLDNLRWLYVDRNQLTTLPDALGRLTQLETLSLDNNRLKTLPGALGQLTQLEMLSLRNNQLTTLPEALRQLTHLQGLVIDGNPLPKELLAAGRQGGDYVRAYLEALDAGQTKLYEAKLVLVGEGEVGKSWLLRALRGEKPEQLALKSTHGVEIWPVAASGPTGQAIQLNAWDFGGQTVYRPTHQLFFSDPAVYVVVWKPREGTQQGAVEYWMRLIKLRAPGARIVVVATHGGPDGRLPDISRQQLRELFGAETVVDFHYVDSLTGAGIQELRATLGAVAGSLPKMGHPVPTRWLNLRRTLRAQPEPYLAWREVAAAARAEGLTEEEIGPFVAVEHELGNLIHFPQYEQVRDIVILKPDWLAKALSFVFEASDIKDECHGVATFERLGELWNDPQRPETERYPPEVHPLLLRLMEEYELSYRITDPALAKDGINPSLIGQLVPDLPKPDRVPAEWDGYRARFEETQVCQILEKDRNQSAPAEGLFYRLIVRLHKYSLGRKEFKFSVHWQRGLLLDAAHMGRALLEQVGYDVRITVRGVKPEGLLSMLTTEVRDIVQEERNGWEGLRCVITVPCPGPCGLAPEQRLAGVFKYEDLLDNASEGIPKILCPSPHDSCRKKFIVVDELLRIAPIQQLGLPESAGVSKGEETIIRLLLSQQGQTLHRFDLLFEKLEEAFAALIRVEVSVSQLLRDTVDVGRLGPRLFDLQPIGSLNPLKQKYRLTLWCEYSRLPLPFIDEATTGKPSTRGTYEISLTREELARLLPYVKQMLDALTVAAGVATVAMPVVGAMLPALAGLSAWLTTDRLKQVRELAESSKKQLESVSKSVKELDTAAHTRSLEKTIRADYEGGPEREPLRISQGEVRALHGYLQEQDKTFGGLVQLRQPGSGEIIWMHPSFAEVFQKGLGS